MRVVKISFPCCPLSAALLVHPKDVSLSKYISGFWTKLKRLDFSIVLLCKGPNISVWLKDVDAKSSYERNPIWSNSNKPQVQFFYPVCLGDSYGTASVANKSFQTKRWLIKWGRWMWKLNSSFGLCHISNTQTVFLYMSFRLLLNPQDWFIALQPFSYKVFDIQINFFICKLLYALLLCWVWLADFCPPRHNRVYVV